MISVQALFCISTLLAAGPPAKEIPDVLERAFLERARYETAFLKYKIIRDWPDLPRTVQNTEARFVRDSMYRIELGDDDGIRERDGQTGVPAFGVHNTCLPESVVLDRQADQWWVLSGSYTHMSLGSGGDRPIFADVRSFGLFSREIQDKTPLDMLDVLREGKDKIRGYRVEKDAHGVHTVILTYKPPVEPGPHGEYRWEIDAKKDFAITHVTEAQVHPDGTRELLSEATAEYDLMDGRWWPRKIESTCPLSGWNCSVEYEHAEFDKLTHPKRLGPETMGVPVGAPVAAPQIGPGFSRYLGDGAVVSKEDWEEIKDQYDLAPLRVWREAQYKLGGGHLPEWYHASKQDFGLKDAAYTPDLWEAYVRRWILIRTSTRFHPVPNPLDEKQVRAAWAILKDCRKRAVPISLRIRKELAETAKVLQSADDAGTARKRQQGDAAKTDLGAEDNKLIAARKRKDALKEPNEIAALFSLLKSRLDQLLTSRQRAGAAPATTQKGGTARRRPSKRRPDR